MFPWQCVVILSVSPPLYLFVSPSALSLSPLLPSGDRVLTDAELWVMSDQLRELESIQLYTVRYDDIQVRERERAALVDRLRVIVWSFT